MQYSVHMQLRSDDDDRQNRFNHPTGTENGSGSLRERAASQPPRVSDQSFLTSPVSSSFTASKGSPWLAHRFLSPTHSAQPQSASIRSSSFTQSQGKLASTMRERFPSTFEDDEGDEELSVPPSLSRDRRYGEVSRSRSQSIATSTRPGLATIAFPGSTMQSWNESLSSNPLNMTSRYGEIKPPGRQNVDPSNMSPFVRDVGQILLDDGSAFRELWSGFHAPRDENGGGTSGTTSRRHSVSVVQPRRQNVVGFNVPGNAGGASGDGSDEGPRSSGFSHGFGGRGGLMLDDDDLASDLTMLNINANDPTSASQKPSSQYPPSQPASLPIYAPVSRSPITRDILSPYPSINLSFNVSSGSFTSRNLHTPSDGGVSAGGTSPTMGSTFDKHHFPDPYAVNGSSGRQSHSPELAGLFPTSQYGVSGQYTRPRVASMSSPLVSPTVRILNPQQAPFYPQQQRRPSLDTSGSGLASLPSPHHHQQPQHQQHSLNELGRGVPLHSVPSSWPLYVVEFKAGRTDLFYCTDPNLDIRIGDLVIVEADRGKDLGTVVHDSITVEGVEALQRERAGTFGAGSGSGGGGSGGGDSPTSAGPGGGKKDINPKQIYGKAQPQDTNTLMAKHQDELKALHLCQSKVRAKKLPMEVVDAEYQWDRRKLTFYFIAEKRIDFRELVRELFRLYKTRIWMASLQGGLSYEQ